MTNRRGRRLERGQAQPESNLAVTQEKATWWRWLKLIAAVLQSLAALVNALK